MNRTEIVLLLSLGFMMIGTVCIWSATRSTSRTLPKPLFHQDDRYWRNGFIYNNPDDPALFVPRRITGGWMLNFGHPKSPLFLAGVTCVILAFATLTALPLGPGCHPPSCVP